MTEEEFEELIREARKQKPEPFDFDAAGIEYLEQRKEDNEGEEDNEKL